MEIPDAALRAILEALRGKQAGDALTTADLATVVSLNLRDSGVADLGGLQHAVNLTDLYLEDFSLDLAPLQGLGLFVHVPGEEPLRLPSTDATLSGLALSDVNISTFDPATTDYTASVGNDVTETTVTATANDGGAAYVIKLGGVEDADGTVALAVGDNAISVVVTAEDGQTTQTYTVTVNRAGPPLTAWFEGVPATHDGTDPFTFRIAFSEPISTSYVVMRDHTLEVTGGTVAAAGRVDGRNDLWWVRVEPDYDADVSIALPADRACDVVGAICTADGKVLSNRPELTVPGPTPVNSPATGAPTISGAAQVGQTLTASTSGIADADGLSNATFSYQWVANDGAADTDIPGATGATHTLAAAEEGQTVKVQVSFTDDGGNGESLTSSATGAVAPPPSTDATLNGLSLSGVRHRHIRLRHHRVHRQRRQRRDRNHSDGDR